MNIYVVLKPRGYKFNKKMRVEFATYSAVAVRPDGIERTIGSVEIYLNDEGQFSKSVFYRSLNDATLFPGSEFQLSELIMETMELAKEVAKKQLGAKI